MGTVTVSSKYQVVISREVRKHLGLKPGQKLIVLEEEGSSSSFRMNPLADFGDRCAA